MSVGHRRASAQASADRADAWLRSPNDALAAMGWPVGALTCSLLGYRRRTELRSSAYAPITSPRSRRKPPGRTTCAPCSTLISAGGNGKLRRKRNVWKIPSIHPFALRLSLRMPCCCMVRESNRRWSSAVIDKDRTTHHEDLDHHRRVLRIWPQNRPLGAHAERHAVATAGRKWRLLIRDASGRSRFLRSVECANARLSAPAT